MGGAVSPTLCTLCGGPTVELFLTRACKAECGLRTERLPVVLVGDDALNALLAHKPIKPADGGPGALWFHQDVRWFVYTFVGWSETTDVSLIYAKPLAEAKDIVRKWWAGHDFCQTARWIVCDPPEAS